MPSANLNQKGTFADVVLPALLVQAMNANFTGMFRAERESIIKVIYFKEGDIAFASSNQPSDRLGEVLIKRGQLTREQLDMAMSKLEANVSLGRMLVELGYLSPKELLAGAKSQVEEILYSLNTWREGTYEFVGGPLAPRIVDLKLNMKQVVYQAIMQLEDRAWVLEQIGSMETVFAHGPDLSESLGMMRLEPEAEQIVNAIDGQSTVRDLCAGSTLDEFTVTKVVAAVHLLSMTTVTEQVAAAAAASDEFTFGEGATLNTGGEDATTLVGGPLPGETVPGFAPTFDAEPEPVEPLEAEEEGATTATLPLGGEETLAAEPAGDEELSYEEEDEEFEDEDDDEWEEEGGRRWLLPVVGIAVLALLGGAGWWFRDMIPFIGGAGDDDGAAVVAVATTPTPEPAVPVKTTPTPRATPTAPTSTAATQATSPPATPRPTATPPRVPSRAPTRVATTRRTPRLPTATTRATPKPRTTAPAPRTTTATASGVTTSQQAEAARSRLGSSDFRGAAQAFQTAVRGQRGYTLQLEIICQEQSIREGWSAAKGAKEYMVVPFSFKGRACYRALWGVYPSVAAARRGAASVPSFFRNQMRGKKIPVVRLSKR